MARWITRLLRLLWTVTFLWIALGSATAYVGPLNWLSALFLAGSGFLTLWHCTPRLTLTRSGAFPAAWGLYLLGSVALTVALSYWATSPTLFGYWFMGVSSVVGLALAPQAWTSRWALLTTTVVLVVVPWLVLRQTSLLPSIAAGQAAHLRLLLRCGANVHERRQHDTPLIAAVGLGRADLVELLLRQGADPNDRSSAFMNYTPVLFDAARLPAHQHRVLALLLQYGADPNLRNGSGETALFHALRFKQRQNVQQLLKAGARTDVRNARGETPLDQAEKLPEAR